MKISEIKIQPRDNSRELAWINRVYSLYPHTFNRNHVMTWGEGDLQELAMFELEPSFTKKNAVEVKWFQAYPLRQGIGSRAMQQLQKLAREDGIVLTLYPWEHGRISQAKLSKFYKTLGFKPTVRGSKAMYWEPELQESQSPRLHGTFIHETTPAAAAQISQRGFRPSRSGIFFNRSADSYSGGGYGAAQIRAELNIDRLLDFADDDLPEELEDLADQGDGEEISDYARQHGYQAWADDLQIAVLDPACIKIVSIK